MKALFGNTYNNKDKIKASGGVWDATKKCWNVPDEKYDELFKLCKWPAYKKSENQSLSNPNKKFSYGRYECCDCCENVFPGSECWETGLTH